MTLITNAEELKNLCAGLKNEEYITVDTEFLRDKTYYPKLCLIQVASEKVEFAVDPMAEGMDLSPLFEVFANQKVMKVFHSARQDIEIILKLSGNVPKPMFDTQVAAMVCGFGASASYATLVSELVGKNVDKSSRFTDWSRRPLSKAQLDYALSDVTYLRTVYKKLKADLFESGREHWLMEEMESLTSPENYVVNPDEIWEKLKPKGTSRRFLGMVREIAKWRELAAQKLDRPRGHILKDQGLLEVAAVIPKSAEEFHAIRSTSGFKKSLVPELLEVIASAQTIPDSQLPEVKRLRKPVKPNENLVEMLKLLLKVKCNELNVAEKLVATSEDLTKMAIGDIMESVVSHGWRYDIFGKHAIALKNGNISLAMKDGRIDIVSNKS
ncbi:MAG: rnd [Rickettsiaceae bacterium]|jgi:ribonuclease D|nr:rnd [Rickettsiaceae bacterium]